MYNSLQNETLNYLLKEFEINLLHPGNEQNWLCRIYPAVLSYLVDQIVVFSQHSPQVLHVKLMHNSLKWGPVGSQPISWLSNGWENCVYGVHRFTVKFITFQTSRTFYNRNSLTDWGFTTHIWEIKKSQADHFNMTIAIKFSLWFAENRNIAWKDV